MKHPISEGPWKRLEAVKSVSRTVSSILSEWIWKRSPSSKMGPFPFPTAAGKGIK
jgi:hypothetical protein